MKKSMMIFLVFALSLSLLTVGCTQSQPGPSPADTPQINVPNPPTVPSENQHDTDDARDNDDLESDDDTDDDMPSAPTMDKTPEPVAVAEGNKSETQKTQDKIAQVIMDGTYVNNVTYRYHSGVETVSISVTTEGDVVTAASVVGINPNRESKKYIDRFNSALPTLVVGKKINEIQIPKVVSGSSLTSAAFKTHLQDLVTQNPA